MPLRRRRAVAGRRKKFGRFVIEAIRQADFGEESLGPSRVVGASGKTHIAQDVLQHGEAGKKVVGLEDVAKVTAAEDIVLGFAERGDIDLALVFGAEEDVTALGGEDSGNQMEQGGLAGTGGADERPAFPRGVRIWGY